MLSFVSYLYQDIWVNQDGVDEGHLEVGLVGNIVPRTAGDEVLEEATAAGTVGVLFVAQRFVFAEPLVYVDS